MTDCADMSSHMSRCHSCKVESGCFVIYDRTNYMGNQYFMKRGEYPDYMSMTGMCNGIRSCRMIPTVGIRITKRLTTGFNHVLIQFESNCVFFLPK